MDRYDVQRRIYALAAPGSHRRPVPVAYVFMERAAEPVEQRFEPGQIEALTAELAELVRPRRAPPLPGH